MGHRFISTKLLSFDLFWKFSPPDMALLMRDVSGGVRKQVADSVTRACHAHIVMRVKRKCRGACQMRRSRTRQLKLTRGFHVGKMSGICILGLVLGSCFGVLLSCVAAESSTTQDTRQRPTILARLVMLELACSNFLTRFKSSFSPRCIVGF